MTHATFSAASPAARWACAATAILFTSSVGCGGGLLPSGPTSVPGPSSGSGSLAGNWTYRQEAPSSCALPSAARVITYSASVSNGVAGSFNVVLQGNSFISQGSAHGSLSAIGGGKYVGYIVYGTQTPTVLTVFGLQAATFTLTGTRLTSTSFGTFDYVNSSTLSQFECRGPFTVTLTRA